MGVCLTGSSVVSRGVDDGMDPADDDAVVDMAVTGMRVACLRMR